jgi:hypothetical protein
MKRPLALLTLSALCLAMAVNTLYATIRYVKPGGGGTGDGSSWSNASGDLQAMIDASGSGDEVWVASGTYKPTTGTDRSISFVMKDGVAIYGGFNGTETLLSQRNWVSNVTVLSGDLNGNDVISGSGGSLQITGNGENSYHVVKNDFTSGNPLTASAILDGFTLTGGHSNDFTNGYSGAGMYNFYASPTLNNLLFLGNQSEQLGGGMYNTLGASPVLYNVTFSRNVALGIGSGGGGGGGGMYNWPGSLPVLNNVHFSGNLTYGSGGGGGVLNNQVSPTFNNCSFSGNYTFAGGGGASNILSSPTFSNCLFSTNGANFYGGAVFNQFNPVVFTNCTFYGNTGLYNGGIAQNSAGTSILRNCIMWANTGIINPNIDGSATVTYSTLQGSLYPGTGNANLPPSFLNPGNPIGADGLWGTADDGLRLQPCSFGINLGDNTDLPATDFAGSTRIFNTTVDMGAYELQGAHTPSTFYQDQDNDGYGNAAVTALSCTPPPGYVADNTDCDDNNNAVNPGATENVCNGIDDDCSGIVEQDNIFPTALCKDISVALVDGSASITASQIDNGSSDNCSVSLLTSLSTLDCSNLGQPVPVQLTVTDPAGNSATCTANVTVTGNCDGICAPTVLVVNAPAPNLSGTITSWTAPSAGFTKVKITAKGAKGGNGRSPGGSGAVMAGEFIIAPGQVLDAIAGAPGQNGPNAAGGGGGGSGVKIQSLPLIIAGGGGGGGYFFGYNGGDGVITSGNGFGGTCSAGASGGGFFGGGCDSYFGGPFNGIGGGAGFGASGGGGTSPYKGGGGFGGGGGANSSGAGGGGYSGGGGANSSGAGGGGGSSYNLGSNQNNLAGANNAGGQVIIECMGPVAFTANVTSTQIACNDPQASLQINLTGEIDGNTTGLEYAIVAGSSFTGSPTFSDITADPFSITSGFGTVAPGTFTIRIRLKYNPGAYLDYTYTLDQVTTLTYYIDADGDLYGGSSVTQCSRPTNGYLITELEGIGDCNDGNPSVNPGAAEVCNGIDDNCDGQVDESPATLPATPPITTQNALNFDGTNDCVAITNCGAATPFFPGGDAITVEYWFKGASNQSAVRLQPDGGIYIVAGWNGMHILSNDGELNGISVGGDATDGNWHHVAMSWQRNTPNGFKSYLDGQLVDQRNSSDTPLPVVNTGMYLGAYNGNSEFMSGTLDEVRIWTVARTGAEIQQSYCSDLSGPQTGLLHEFLFDHGDAGNDNTGIDVVENTVNADAPGLLKNFTLNGSTSNWVQGSPSVDPGDPALFGNNEWNVYVWNAGGANINGNAWNLNYAGYYVETNLNINTETRWNAAGAPSDASGYAGCAVGADNHSYSYKRKGFPQDYYAISVDGHDDAAQLWVNGSMVWEHDGCCDAHPHVWIGNLGTTDEVEFRVTEGGGGSAAYLSFALLCPPGNILYVNDDASGNNDGSSWANAFTDLQDALALTSTCTSITEIWVAEGTYYPTSGTDRNISFSMINGVGIYGGFDGTETQLSQRDWVTSVTTLSGDIGIPGDNSDNSFHIISNNMNGLDDSAILDGFTITGGNDNRAFPNGFGGGIYNNTSSPTISHCVFSDNAATYGGAIFNENSTMKAVNCIFAGNTGYDGGAAMQNNGSNSIVTNCSFYGNNSSNSAMYNLGANPVVTNCIFWGNSSAVTNNNSVPVITYCIVQGGYTGAGNLNADPLFVDAANGDLHLDQCSPAIDAGTNTGAPPNDLDGNARPYNGGIPDMGAYEHQGVKLLIVYVNNNASGNNDGSSWDDAYNDLQDALDTPCSNTEIWVAAGTYYPTKDHLGNANPLDPRDKTFFIDKDLKIFGGFPNTGNPTMDDRNWSTHPTVLDGDLGADNVRSNNAYTVVYPYYRTNACLLDGFIIQNGEGINGNIQLQNRGGGIYLVGSSPTVQHCRFNNNYSTAGGAIYAENSQASFVNCGVFGNVADVGGALYNRSSNTTFLNCTFSNNLSFNGAGIFAAFTPSPTFTNCIIWDNDGRLTQQQGANSIVNYSIIQGGYAGAGNLDEDPLFVDPANGDFRLQASSCAIDNGLDSAVPAGVTTDLDGNPRFYNGGQVDIGAYEFQGPFQPPVIVVPPTTTHNGLDFDGVDDHVKILTNCGANTPFPGGDAITVEYWFKGTNSQSAVRMQNNNGYIVAAWQNNVHILSNDGGTSGVSAGVGFNDGNWHHMAFTWQRNTPNGFKSYLDGQLVDQRNSSDTPLPVLNTGMYLGAYNGSSEFMSGTLDEVRIWTVARTGAEIQESYCNGLSGPQTGLLHEFRFDHGDAGNDNTGIDAVENTVNAAAPGLLKNFTLNGNASNWEQGRPSDGIILYVNDDASGNNDGSSWTDAFTDLQDALSLANTCSNVTEIWVAEGVYKPTSDTDRNASFSMQNNLAIYGGFEGTETQLSQRDWAAHETILSGDIGTANDAADNSYHVIYNSYNGLNNTAVIDGFTITGGNADGSGLDNRGGGMYNSLVSPLIVNCTFIDNQATRGGAVYNANPSTPTFTNCLFTNNLANDGGAAFNDISSARFKNCSFSENSGFAISNVDATPLLTNCIIWSNGAGIKNAGSLSSVAAVSYSIVQGGYGGTGNLDEDPLFVDPANGDFRLQACSPAINAGDNAAVPSGVTTDLDKNPRFYNAGTVDMGAYEFQGTPPFITCYLDGDSDNFGDPTQPQVFCQSCGAGYVADNTDCDDSDPNITLCNPININVSISDPCTCLNNATQPGNGQFSETVQVTGSAGESWTVKSVTGLFLPSSPAPPAAPLPVSIGDPLPETAPGSGVYELQGIHVDGQGYSITVTNGAQDLSISNLCYYPEVALSGLAESYCSKSGPATVTAVGQPPATVENVAFTIFNAQGNVMGTPQSGASTAYTFDPAGWPSGVYTLRVDFDAADNGGANPGCVQRMEQPFEVRKVGCGVFPWDGD